MTLRYRPIAFLSLALTAIASHAAASPNPPISCDEIAFPGGAFACQDYLGDAWNASNAGADCSAYPGASGPGVLAVGSACEATGILGTCTVHGGTDTETRLNFESGDLATLASSCENFLQGVWSTPIAGSCEHAMVFGPPGTPAMPVCKQYEAGGWDATAAQADCDALTQGAYASTACDTSPLGLCSMGDSSLFFYVGDAAALEAGCEASPPYGLGGTWVATQTNTLPQEVVDSLMSDAAVTVTPDGCVDDDCLTGVMSAGGAITFQPADGSATRGLVVYPGGMVEPRAYAVAAREIAETGAFVAVVPFPGNLPITDPMRGLGTVMANPQIQHWAVAGHSLGGVAASIWAFANPAGKLEGIAFWASYPAPAMPPNAAADLSASGLKAISITASHDGVLNWPAYEATRDLLPAATYFATIRGGNHAQFGYYGEQDGDQPALIARAHQHELFTGATVHLLNRLGLEPDQDVIHPIHEQLDTLTDALCTPLQLHLAGMKPKNLRARDVSVEPYVYESDFVSSKPSFPDDGSALVAVTAHAHQGANLWDITAPPIFDSEVWCKMKSQEAIAAEYGITPKWASGSCDAANAWVFDYAMANLGISALLNYWFSGTQLDFGDDLMSDSGPVWLATDVALDDLGSGLFSLQASHLHTLLVGAPPPYNGNDYCRVWSPQAAAQFILRQGN